MGDLIVRVGCHGRFPADYLRRCAVAAAIDSAFGGIGWTRHGADSRHEVDTVTFGALRPDAFAKAGLYDETTSTAAGRRPVIRKHERPTRARSRGPLAFMLGLVALIPLSM
jgi:hypothetical protein